MLRVVHRISFHIKRNEILGVVGESGSGKSVTAMTILGLLPKKETLLDGELLFEGNDLLRQTHENLRKLRGKQNCYDISGANDCIKSFYDLWGNKFRKLLGYT